MTSTTLRYIMDPGKLFDQVAEGYVRQQTHPDHPELAIFNYTEKCAWDKAWTPETLECRGLIVHKGNEPVVVARPFPKFFNWDEREIDPTIVQGRVEVTDKLDGSLGIGYRHKEVWRVATRGSFASDQAKWATEWLHGGYLMRGAKFTAPLNWTPLWEILYPANRIVVDYKGYEGLVLLGWRHMGTGEIRGPEEFHNYWAGDRSDIMPADSFAGALLLEPRHNAEGVVVRWLDSGHQVKIKQDDYKRMHAVVTNTTNRTVWASLAAGEDPTTMENLPDEFMSWVKYTKASLERTHWEKMAEVEIQFAHVLRALNGDHSRKDFAAKAQKSPLAPALFQKYDGKNVSDWCWRQIKPETIERPFAEGS